MNIAYENSDKNPLKITWIQTVIWITTKILAYCLANYITFSPEVIMQYDMQALVIYIITPMHICKVELTSLS